MFTGYWWHITRQGPIVIQPRQGYFNLIYDGQLLGAWPTPLAAIESLACDFTLRRRAALPVDEKVPRSFSDWRYSTGRR